MSEFWIWITEHYFLGFLLAYVIIESIRLTISRLIRLTMVLTRGWPDKPLMDADGDIVHPTKDET